MSLSVLHHDTIRFGTIRDRVWSALQDDEARTNKIIDADRRNIILSMYSRIQEIVTTFEWFVFSQMTVHSAPFTTVLRSPVQCTNIPGTLVQYI